MRPPSRQKEPSCALGISSDEDYEGYPSEKIVLTSSIPGKSNHGRQKSREFRDSDSDEESHNNQKIKVNKRFESDDEQNEEYEQIGDLSDDSSEGG